MESRNHIKGFLYVLFSVCIWSGWVVVSRYGVKGALSVYDITAIRFTTSGLLMLPIVLRKGFRIGPWGIWSGLLISILMGSCYTNVMFIGMRYAPVSHASTVNNGAFLTIITLIGMHGLREHVSKTRLFGVFCTLAGIGIMLAAKSGSNAMTSEEWLGHLCFITAGAMWAVYVVLARAWHIDALHAAAVICVLSMLTYMPFYLYFADSHISMQHGGDVLLQLVYQGVITGVLALVVFNKGIHLLGAARAGSVIPLIPALSTLLAIPILHEYPSAMEWAGIAAVSFGVSLSSGALRWRHSRTLAQVAVRNID